MSSPSPRAAILSFSPLAYDARVLRQVKYLAWHYAVSVIAYGEAPFPPDAGFEMLPVTYPGGLRLGRKTRTLAWLTLARLRPALGYERWYWGRDEHRLAFEHLLRVRAQVIHANDVMALPVAARAARQTRAQLVLDLHEYAPLEAEDRWLWRALYQPMVDYCLRTYAPAASASVTVNQTIADRYAADYGLRPLVVMNAPERVAAVAFRPVDPQCVRLVHHGGAMPERKLELMIDTIARADVRYNLHFILVGNPSYVARLRALAQRLAPGRVFFHPPVRPEEIVGRIAEFDMGIFILPFVNFNWQVALPNKFFDFIAAGLGVCIGPSPEMARLTRQYGFGTVAPSFEPPQVAEVLNRLTAADIDQMKRRALQAREVLNADVEMGKLVALYERVLAGQS